jgi:hypothetical protein
MTASQPRDSADGRSNRRANASKLSAEKKKSCRERKCSKWKGGKCRCGRD